MSARDSFQSSPIRHSQDHNSHFDTCKNHKNHNMLRKPAAYFKTLDQKSSRGDLSARSQLKINLDTSLRLPIIRGTSRNQGSGFKLSKNELIAELSVIGLS